MPGVEVLIPYQAGCEHRARAIDWVADRYYFARFRVRIRRLDPTEPWVKARAVNALLQSSRADIVVIADADVWVAPTGVHAAVDAIAAGAGWAIPHGSVRRLSPEATAAVLAGGELSEDLELAERSYRGIHTGGLVIARRETLLEIPLDPRFIGWGGEDQAWGYALHTLLGDAWEGAPPLYHLWHPPQERMTRRVGSVQNDQLRRRYVKARRDPAVMRALIAEHREEVLVS